MGEQFAILSELTPLAFTNVFTWCLARGVIWEPLDKASSDHEEIWSDLEACGRLGHSPDPLTDGAGI